MKVELSKDLRIKRDENYEILRSIEHKISERIKAEFQKEIQDIRKENEKLHDEDRAFCEEAKKVLIGVKTTDKLKVQTQTGKGSIVVKEYFGSIEKPYKYGDGTFNFISPSIYDGKPFTIGFSCLLSIEIL